MRSGARLPGIGEVHAADAQRLCAGHVFLLVVTLCVLFECLGMQLVRGFKRIEVNEVFDEK